MQEKVYTELYQENTKAGEGAETKSKAKPYRLCWKGAALEYGSLPGLSQEYYSVINRIQSKATTKLKQQQPPP